MIQKGAGQRAQHLQGASGIRVLGLFAAPLLSGVAEQSVKPRLFLLLVCRAQRFVVDGNQPRHVAVPGLIDLLGRGQARAGLAQLVAHGVACILGRTQLVGERPVHQGLRLRGRQSFSGAGNGLPIAGYRLRFDRSRPGKQQEEDKESAHNK